ncbi:MAG: glutaminyl-peptide cyclotransferase [Ardenticatenales bacterium]|nr:glutaminyl-peptide cyclotransferase [Ardenticatenales bacterium]
MAVPFARCAAPAVAAGLALALAGCLSTRSSTLPPGAASPAAADGASTPAEVADAVPAGTAPPANRLVPIVLAAYPHDPGAFTQGLLLDGDTLFESTGLEGQSTLREVELESGSVVRRYDVPPDVFAEGLALVDDTLYQLSWQEERAFAYDRSTFALKKELSYDGEGWGLCHDGQQLVMSDGSDHLTFRDPASFAPTGNVAVTLDGTALPMLNELECVGDRVYANVWQTNLIVAIDPSDGRVTDVIDASSLQHELTDRDVTLPIDVLNGIAFDPADETFLLTGKLWPKIFRVRFAPAVAPIVPTPGALAP